MRLLMECRELHFGRYVGQSDQWPLLRRENISLQEDCVFNSANRTCARLVNFVDEKAAEFFKFILELAIT